MFSENRVKKCVIVRNELNLMNVTGFLFYEFDFSPREEFSRFLIIVLIKS